MLAAGRWNTLPLMEQLGNSFPKKGHIIIWDGYSFELLKVKNYEIKEVKIKSTNGDHLREKNQDKETDDNQKVGAK